MITRLNNQNYTQFPASTLASFSRVVVCAGRFFIFRDDTMKHIKLTQGKHALVDNEDYLLISQNKWTYNEGYAVRTIWLYNPTEQIHISMHQQIMNTPFGYDTHHINNNRCDNRKKNLVICTRKEHFTKYPKQYKKRKKC